MQEQTGTPLTSTAPAAPAEKAGLGRFWVVALATAVADQASKFIALRSLTPGERYPVLGDLISLRLIRNPGAAFSAFDGMTLAVTVLAMVIVAGIVHRVHTRPQSAGLLIVLGLIAGGAAGNLVDRFFREPGIGRGHVVDFIDYFGAFVGNVADIAIVLAAAGYLLMTLRQGPDDASRPGATGPDQGKADA